MKQIKQITLRGLSPRLSEEILRLSREDGISINKAALRLLEKGAGISRSGKTARRGIGDSLDHLIGTWSEEEAEHFLKAIRSCEQIDPEFWA